MGTANLKGHGVLYEGATKLGEGDYVVTGTLPELTGGVVRVVGHISTEDVDIRALRAAYMANQPPTLSLHLENNLQWDCMAAGEDGRLLNSDGFFRMVDGVRTKVPTLVAFGL